jgi:hypothetical protein
MRGKRRMKKILYAMLALIMIGNAVAAAIYSPLPISGKVVMGQASGLEVRVTNLRSGKVLEATTNDAGEYLIEAANFDDNGGTTARYSVGDQFRIELPLCSQSYAECSRTVTYTGQPEIYTLFDISGIQAVQPPTCPSCPSCPADSTPYASCSECCPLQECKDTSWQNIGLGALIGGLVAAVALFGGGIKIYRNKLGKAVFQHTHKGVTGYHDPNTKHINKAYQHRLWKNDPLGCMNDVQTIENKGGLI